MAKKSSFYKLNLYIGREYILSFLISFIFFFFIFFVNQILVLAQKVMLKNINASDIILLVTLAIPQFLMYTMPFSSLTSASMVIGNLSSQNEIIAMRATGIHTRRIFMPIVFLSVFISIGTLFIADRLIPYTAMEYRQLYAKMIQNTPTLELENYSSTQFGNRIISNGEVKDNVIYDVIIFDNEDSTDSRVITAESARISVIDIEKFLYRIELENPEIFITDSSSLDTFSVARAKHLELNIDLSSSGSIYSNISPSQMSLRLLRQNIADKLPEHLDSYKSHAQTLSEEYANLLNVVEEVGASKNPKTESFRDIEFFVKSVGKMRREIPYSFMYQYFGSEYQKKLALSLACTCLVFLAFPLSFVKVKYGRLFGFGLSMFFACIYWFVLYFCHMKAVTSGISPKILLWAPNVVILFVGLAMLIRLGRR